jgi:hypothetical protein
MLVVFFIRKKNPLIQFLFETETPTSPFYVTQFSPSLTLSMGGIGR